MSEPDEALGLPRDELALFFLALGLRLAWAAFSGRLFGYSDDGLYDDGVYIAMARSFLGHGPEPFLTHPPGYSIFLAPFLRAGDWGLTAARWVQFGLGASLAPLSSRLSRRLGFNRQATLLAGLFTAFDPMLVYFNARFMPETLFLFLVTGFFLHWSEAWQKGSDFEAALAGLAGGLATVVRGVLLPFGAVLAVAAFFLRRFQPRWVRLIGLCGVVWALSLVPWTARNYLRYGRFVPVSVQGGWNLYEGLTVDPDEVHHKRPAAMGAEAKALGLSDPFAVDAHFAAKAKAWIGAHPGEFLRLCWRKALKFWRLSPGPPHSALARWGAGVFSLLLFAGALMGSWRFMHEKPVLLFFIAWVFHLTLLHSVFASNLRYRLPLIPFLAVLAGAGYSRRENAA
ncbi:MAG: glycosyltransferase family 39 protein [Elusimicrobia bacterium]|nr:glycosyltransferase family 39 protein [Elusimicrobiota bacterium]